MNMNLESKICPVFVADLRNSAARKFSALDILATIQLLF